MREPADGPPHAADAELRLRAEKRLGFDKATWAPTTPEETALLLHELRVHQIELEMQNEELRRAQEELAASQATHVELFDLAPIGYITLSDKNIVLKANLTAARLLGVERAALVGAPFTSFILPADQDVFYHHSRRIFAGGDGRRCELHVRRRLAGAAGEEPLWVELTGRTQTTAEQEVVHWLTFSDISQRRLAEEKILHLNADLERQTRGLGLANTELEAFVYSITHDLRSPLRALAGFSELLALDYGEVIDGTGRDYLRRIKAAALHLGAVMDALLALSRVNRADVDLRRVDLSAMAGDMAAQLRAAEPDRAVEFEIQDRLAADSDPVLCEVLLRNLLENAWKYTRGRSPAHITVGATDADGRRVFRVSDDGVGFDQEYAARLFHAFERLHAQEEFPGTGLGLATVRRIVERFGGECWATGEVDKGATVYFTLPAPAPAEPQATSTAAG
jgi:PAS domain S-box-containing protein